jgi:hypothetical protein
VLGGDQGHVVGHHVEHDAEAVRMRLLGQLLEPVAAAELGADAAVVHDVVPVQGAGGRLQHR